MLVVPLASVASQTLNIVLANVNCQIKVYQLNTGVYFDLVAGGTPITNTARCLTDTRLIRNRGYLGFPGDFVFIDTQGSDDPVYSGLGSRWVLLYLEAADFDAAS